MLHKNKPVWIAVFLALGLIFMFTGCGRTNSSSNINNLQIKGSDTMVNLGQAWAEAFMKNHPQANIAVTGGGSGTGISALISKTCDICMSSRNIKKKRYLWQKIMELTLMK